MNRLIESTSFKQRIHLPPVQKNGNFSGITMEKEIRKAGDHPPVLPNNESITPERKAWVSEHKKPWGVRPACPVCPP
jgi:hypothetical protein